MTTAIKIIFFTIISILVIIYIDNGIRSFDLRFYSSKDNGYVVRLESICLLSSLFFLLMTRHQRIKSTVKDYILNIINYLYISILGFIIGIVSSIVSYVFISMLPGADTVNKGLIFHLLAITLFIVAFYALDKRKMSVKGSNA